MFVISKSFTTYNANFAGVILWIAMLGKNYMTFLYDNFCPPYIEGTFFFVYNLQIMWPCIANLFTLKCRKVTFQFCFLKLLLTSILEKAIDMF